MTRGAARDPGAYLSPTLLAQGATINTSHGQFLIRSPDPDLPPRSLILRGVNLSSSSKYPSARGSPPALMAGASTRSARTEKRRWEAGARSHLDDELWREAADGGRDGWFVGHPLQEDDFDLHLRRLSAWGFTTIRLVVVWEALEHAGPGKYDEEYIAYLIRLLNACKAHGYRVFISAHQDVFSRFTGGSGAPYWVLEALGLNPMRIHQTGAAILHSQWGKHRWGGEEGTREAENDTPEDFPALIWNTNLHRLASRHCFTMFFGSETFAPKCKIDGVPVGKWLRGHHVAAYAHFAQRISEAGGLLDTCVIGWDSLNEPHEGFIGIPDLNEIPPSQSFRKGPSPTPLQGFRLGMGQAVDKVSLDDFSSLGLKKLGKTTFTPPEGQGVWLTREEALEAASKWGWKLDDEWDFWDANGGGGCPWAAHGVWDPATGEIIQPDYFKTDTQGQEYAFLKTFWKNYFEEYLGALRQVHPNAIAFVIPPIFETPPEMDESIKNGRVALSCHFYDGLTMLGKRRHKFNANAVGIQRGQSSILQALKVGTKHIKQGLRSQLEELKKDAGKKESMAEDMSGRREYPTIIGELGVPLDMKKTNLLGLGRGKDDRTDYTQPAKAMDELLQGCEGSNTLSYTLWNYEPTNTHLHGDGWNGEDLSIFSYADLKMDEDVPATNPLDLQTLLTLGPRGVEAWNRPYPVETMGRIQSFAFNMSSTIFELSIQVPSLQGSRLWQDERSASSLAKGEWKGDDGWTVIYLPFVHYLAHQDHTHSAQVGLRAQSGHGRVLGRPGTEGEWERDQGPARVDIEVMEISVGRVEVEGQWAKWIYPLSLDQDREIHLKLRKWSG